ncbi:MAG: YtxH domain-containing protein [Chryseolinea sp.]
MKNTKKLIGGLIAGAALGIAVGLLLAPRSGVKTRKKLMGGSLRMKDDVLSSVEDSLDTLRKQFNHKIDQLAKSGKEIINNASEKVKVG